MMTTLGFTSQLSHTATMATGIRARHFGRAELGEQLLAVRRYLREHVVSLSDEQLAAPMLGSINPPLWEAAHVAWFAEWWCGRDAYNTDNGETRADIPSCWAGCDSFLNSSLIAHDARWHLPQVTRAATLDYLDRSLGGTLSRLESVDETDDALYPFRLALFHEAMHLEAIAWTAQTLAWARPAWVREMPLVRPDDGDAMTPLPYATNTPGSSFAHENTAPHTGFTFDNERGGIRAEISESKISTNPVTNASYLHYLLRQRSNGVTVAPPVYWRETANGWEQRRFDAWLPLVTDEPVIHVSAIEAENYCGATRNRLPTEAELHTVFTTGMAPFGNTIWEWTATAFAPYPGFRADRYREYSAPWFDGKHRVLRGGSYATLDLMHHASYRNFFLPHRSDVFAGFRTVAL